MRCYNTFYELIVCLGLSEDVGRKAWPRVGTMGHKMLLLRLQDLYKGCAAARGLGGGVKRGDVCYEMLRAAAV